MTVFRRPISSGARSLCPILRFTIRWPAPRFLLGTLSLRMSQETPGFVGSRFGICVKLRKNSWHIFVKQTPEKIRGFRGIIGVWTYRLARREAWLLDSFMNGTWVSCNKRFFVAAQNDRVGTLRPQ